jgi:hypothetical protein
MGADAECSGQGLAVPAKHQKLELHALHGPPFGPEKPFEHTQSVLCFDPG